MSIDLHIILFDRQPLAARDADHLGDQIEAGDHLGDRVLDLDAGVDLDEIETLGRAVVKKLDRAGTFVPHLRRELDRRCAHRRADLRIQVKGRRLLPHFLATPLQGTFALEAMHEALAIAQDLHFDVACARDHFLDVEPAVAKRRRGLGGSLWKLAREFFAVLHHAYAASAATGGGLDHDGIADALSKREAGIDIAETRRAARYGRHTGVGRHLARRNLVAEQTNRVAVGADENQSGGRDRVGEISVLGQEAIAGMHGIGTAGARRLDDSVDLEIGLGGGRWTYLDGLVGQAHRQRVAVGAAMDLHRTQVQGSAGAIDAHRYFAAVRDQYAVDVHTSISAMSCSASIASPSSTMN